MSPPEQILARPDGTAIAYHHTAGRTPGVVFCGGFMSDMSGTKASALEVHCSSVGRAYTRFDYRGHGRSSGRFVEGTVGLWAEDAGAVLAEVTTGPQIVVGSSMGGWIMLLLALARPDRVAGLVGIAPAPDFVLRMWEAFGPEIRRELERDGVYRRPSQYGDGPYEITMSLIEDGRRNLVLPRAAEIRCPVRILHGMADPDVPWAGSLELVERLGSDDVEAIFVKSGDHRLSTPEDIARMSAVVEALARDPV